MNDNLTLAELSFTATSSSEEVGFEATNLHEYNEVGNGWQSNKQSSEDTQTLILKIQHNDDDHIVHSIDILSHENKIAQSVEITLGSCSQESDGTPTSFSFADCDNICKLGYITLSNNDGSDCQSREMKSIPIEKRADIVKLVLRGCHPNPHNIDNQVCLVGIRVVGYCRDQGRGIVTNTPPRVVNEPPLLSSNSTSVTMKKQTPRVTVTPSARLPQNVRQTLDTKMQSGLDRLEQMKKDAARNEDFEAAGAIKAALGNVYALLCNLTESSSKMKEAAAEEEYSLAAKLKSERDFMREQATRALQEVEQQFLGKTVDEMAGDLSISTIKDESFLSKGSAKKYTPKKSFLETSIADDSSSSINCTESSRHSNSIESSSHGRLHPLSGIDNAEELPAPEDITDSSPDLVHKVENIFQSYRTKCFYSKNWQLVSTIISRTFNVIQYLPYGRT